MKAEPPSPRWGPFPTTSKDSIGIIDTISFRGNPLDSLGLLRAFHAIIWIHGISTRDFDLRTCSFRFLFKLRDGQRPTHQTPEDRSSATPAPKDPAPAVPDPNRLPVSVRTLT